jgi:methanogenic corrinoid protein MtbC1
MYAGLDILRPHLKHEENQIRHKIVIGVVEGDTHDIGKNLVKIMLEASGFDIVDLGRDIPPQRFVDEAVKAQASVIALSTLMTTTMDGMAEVISCCTRPMFASVSRLLSVAAPSRNPSPTASARTVTPLERQRR